MALNWRTAAIPANDTFVDVLYRFLVPLEAATPQQRHNVLPVPPPNGNPTIGIGFDLIAGRKPVQDGVLIGMGFNQALVERNENDFAGLTAAQTIEIFRAGTHI